MADLVELKNAIDHSNAAIEAWKTRESARISEIEKRLNRPGAGFGGSGDDGDLRKLHDAVRAAFRGSDAEIKAMSTDVDPAGGYLVTPMLDRQVRLIRDNVSPLSSLAREIVLADGNAAELPRSLGTLPTGWVSELGSRPETATLDVAIDRIELAEVYCMPSVTARLLDDSSYDVGAILVDQIGHGLAMAEAAALHVGNGIGRPRGFATYTTAATDDATRAWGTIQHVNTGASGAFAASNPADVLFDLVAALAPQYRADARWLMSRGTHNAIRKLKSGTASEYLLRPGLAEGEPDRLLGFPVVLSEDCPAIGANALAIWFGDWRQAYTIVRRPGLNLLRDPFSNKGKVLFYCYQRVGGAVVDFRALKAVRFGT